MKKFHLPLFIILASFCFLNISCKNDENKFYLNEKTYFFEAPENVTIDQIDDYSSTSILLTSRDFHKISRLIKNKENYIWLKISFELPEKLKNKELGLFINSIHNANRIFVNKKLFAQYGGFPPHEEDAGFGAQYVRIPKEDLLQNETNTIYIQIWAKIFPSISSNIFLTDYDYYKRTFNFIDLINSKINLVFIGGLFCAFLIFYILFITQQKIQRKDNYLFFSLTNLGTIIFLTPFYYSNIGTVNLNYLLFLKFFLFWGAYITIYFAAFFISAFLNKHFSNKERIIRFVWLVIPCLAVLFPGSYTSLTYVGFTGIFLMLGQICYSICDLVKAFLIKETRSSARRLLNGFIPVLTALILDIVTRIFFKNLNLPIFTILGWQITIVVFLFYLSNDFNNTYVKNMELSSKLLKFNEELEEKIRRRTKELDKTNHLLMQSIDMINKDLETATLVQQGFMPPTSKRLIGWDIAITYRPFEHVSGDLYDYYTTGNKLDGLGLFDVSGHGTSAGLVTMLSKNIIAQDFQSGKNKSSVSDILLNINQNIISAKSYADRYLTGLLFKFSDFDKHDKCYIELSNAGHPYPLFYSSATNEVRELKYQDPNQQYGLIGIENLRVSFPTTIFSASLNDIIVCFTDGITEASNSKGDQFGTKMIKELLPKCKNLSSDEIMQKILTELYNFTKGKTINDDLTLIVLKRNTSEDFIEEI